MNSNSRLDNNVTYHVKRVFEILVYRLITLTENIVTKVRLMNARRKIKAAKKAEKVLNELNKKELHGNVAQ